MSPTPINLWRSARLIVCALSLSTCACAALAGERDAFVVGAVPGAILPLEFAAPSTVPGPSGPSGAAGASEAAPAVQGISADYAREVALRLSRPLEWRVYPDRSAMMEALAHSEIDAATAATGNDTDLPVVLSHPYLPTQQIFIEARTKHAPTGRVAYVEAQTSPTRLQSAYPHLHPVSYRSVSSALLAVAIGDADAFVGDLVAASYTMDHFDLTGLRVSGFAPFDEGGYIFAFAAGKPGVTELVEQVNAALARLPARFQLEAHSRWGVTTAAVDANGPLDLTDAERAWIAAHPVVTYAMLDRAAPLGFRDARGNPAGFAVDMLEAIERLTGLHFVPRVDFSIEDIERDLSDGTALLTPVPLPPVEGVRLLSSRPFGEGLFVIVTRTGSTPRRNPDALKGVRVAVPASSLVGAEVQRRVPSVQLVETTGHHAIFDALASGRADAAVSEMGFANYAASNPYRDKLEITGVFSSEPEQYRFSVVEREPVLAGILDRALGRLHGAQLDAIRSRWSLGEHPETLWERRRPLVQFTAAIGAGIVVLLCAWAMSLRTQITRRAAAEAALRAAKEEAETANRAKSTFLATMSHEIRTPMSAVLGLLELELRGPGDRASTERSLATAQQAARELLSLIDDILDVAKIEAERLDLAPAPLELDAWVESVAAIYGQAARGKDIRLTVEKRGSAGPAWVTADALRLRQVVGNLLSNAIKFTSKGGVTLAYRVGEMANGVREVMEWTPPPETASMCQSGSVEATT